MANNKKIRSKIEDLLKMEKRPMTTQEIVSKLSSDRRTKYTSNMVSQLLRDRRFTHVGSHRGPENGGAVKIWYLTEASQ